MDLELRIPRDKAVPQQEGSAMKANTSNCLDPFFDLILAISGRHLCALLLSFYRSRKKPSVPKLFGSSAI